MVTKRSKALKISSKRKARTHAKRHAAHDAGSVYMRSRRLTHTTPNLRGPQDENNQLVHWHSIIDHSAFNHRSFGIRAHRHSSWHREQRERRRTGDKGTAYTSSIQATHTSGSGARARTSTTLGASRLRRGAPLRVNGTVQMQHASEQARDTSLLTCYGGVGDDWKRGKRLRQEQILWSAPRSHD